MAKPPPTPPKPVAAPVTDDTPHYAYGMIQSGAGCWKLVKIRWKGDPNNPAVKIKFGEDQPRMVAFDELVRKINELFLQERV